MLNKSNKKVFLVKDEEVAKKQSNPKRSKFNLNKVKKREEEDLKRKPRRNYKL